MNINSIARSIGAQWLNRSIAMVGTVLIAGAVALGLASRATINVAPAAAPAASVSAAQVRYAAFKQLQAEQVADALMPLPPAQISTRERYLALKDRQAEAHDATFVPANAYAPLDQHERHAPTIDQKARETGFYYTSQNALAAPVRDATFVRAPEVASGRERFAALKDHQAEQHDTTVVPVPAHPTGRERFAAMKERQAEMREVGSR